MIEIRYKPCESASSSFKRSRNALASASLTFDPKTTVGFSSSCSLLSKLHVSVSWNFVSTVADSWYPTFSLNFAIKEGVLGFENETFLPAILKTKLVTRLLTFFKLSAGCLRGLVAERRLMQENDFANNLLEKYCLNLVLLRVFSLIWSFASNLIEKKNSKKGQYVHKENSL